MAHSMDFDDVTFTHNGDYSGDVKITRQAPSQSDCENVRVPMDTLEQFLTEKYRTRLIADLERLDFTTAVGRQKMIRLYMNAQTMLRVY